MNKIEFTGGAMKTQMVISQIVVILIVVLTVMIPATFNLYPQDTLPVGVAFVIVTTIFGLKKLEPRGVLVIVAFLQILGFLIFRTIPDFKPEYWGVEISAMQSVALLAAWYTKGMDLFI